MLLPLYIIWQGHNETGVDIIDEQHRGIVSIINSLFYMMNQGMDRQLICSCISDTLIDYSQLHFLTEELFLEEAEYPDLEQHKEQHGNLNKELQRIKRQGIMYNEVRPLLEFLKKWWFEHINDQDQLYASHLLEFHKDSPTQESQP